jgi:hypothetical protein
MALYESVLNGDASSVKNVFLELRDDKVSSLWNEFFLFEQIADSNQSLLNIGLLGAIQTAEEIVHDVCGTV